MPCDLGRSWANIYGSSVGYLKNTRNTTYLLSILEGIKITLITQNELMWGPGLALYSNCFQLPSDWLSQQLNSQSEGSSKQLPGFGVPGFVVLKVCCLYYNKFRAVRGIQLDPTLQTLLNVPYIQLFTDFFFLIYSIFNRDFLEITIENSILNRERTRQYF